MLGDVAVNFMLGMPTDHTKGRGESKSDHPDFRHRALRHHAEGIFLAERLFGVTIRISTGRLIPVRWIAERHVKEDLAFIPAAADWLKAIQPQPWMLRQGKLLAKDPVESLADESPVT